jgi:uncharacterized protein (UPF0147 family)
MATDIGQVSEMLGSLMNDAAIPKNIRKALLEAKERLESNDEPNVKVSAAIYLIESISDDINMPSHARTQIWSILGVLESIKQG